MKLIDLDALNIGKANPAAFQNRAHADGWNSLYTILLNAPVVDEVEWNSVKDKLPEKDGAYLVAMKPDWANSACTVSVERFRGDRFVTGGSNWITHWMPLPEPPKEECTCG